MTLGKTLLQRLQTGVPGPDDVLGGGLPKGFSLRVTGPSGSGKRAEGLRDE